MVQSDGRTPQPFRMPASKLLVRTLLPKLVFDITPHRSPPALLRSCAAGSNRLQSGTKSWFASVHARVTPAVPKADVVCGIRREGLALAYVPETPAPSRYLPRLHFSAVRPLPNRSYATPIRVVMSL